MVFNRNQFGEFPSFLQMVLAAVIGVGIGLMIVKARGQMDFAHFDFHIPGLSTNQAQVTPQPHKTFAIFDPFKSIANMASPLDHRMNILLMGVDSNGRNTQRFIGTRSDTMMVVSVDPDTQKVGIVSIPRDSRVAIANGHGEDKINAAHAFGGPDLSVATVESVFGIPIDRYVVVDTEGLKKLFQILGPVDVLVEKKMTYTDNTAGLHIALLPGLQTLDPIQAEEYVRFRHDFKGDIGRIDRQQWFIRQVYKKLQDPQIILKLPELIDTANEYVTTNLTIDEMAKLAAFARGLTSSQIETAMLPGQASTINGISYWLPDFDGAAIVFNRLLGVTASSRLTTDRFGSQDMAWASNSKYSSQLPNGVITLNIRYAKGSEAAADSLETLATNCGYRVKYKVRADIADCQHNEIIENSGRVEVSQINTLRHELPCLSSWPSVVSFDSQASADLTLVLSPQSCIESAMLPGHLPRRY